MPSGVYKRKPITEEARKNLSLSHKGISTWNKGLPSEQQPFYRKTQTQKAKNNISKALKGKPKTVIHKKHLSESLKGEKNPWYGKHHSDETKKKCSESKMGSKNYIFGKKRSQKDRDAISKGNKGKPKTSKHCKNISLGKKGKEFSEEHKQNLKLARINVKPKFQNTKIEVAVQNILRDNNILFEVQKNLLGHPDIFIEPNICIFCDGEYFHANPKKYTSNTIMYRGRTAKFIWDNDKEITKTLEIQGYIVLRFWEDEINNDLKKCFENIYFLLCQ